MGGKACIHFSIAAGPTTILSLGGMNRAPGAYILDAPAQSDRSTRAVKVSTVARTAARSAALNGLVYGSHASVPRAVAARSRTGERMVGSRVGGVEGERSAGVRLTPPGPRDNVGAMRESAFDE